MSSRREVQDALDAKRMELAVGSGQCCPVEFTTIKKRDPAELFDPNFGKPKAVESVAPPALPKSEDWGSW